MGLDITAYRKLTPAPDAKVDEDGCPVDDAVWRAYRNPNFRGRDAGLVGDLFTYESSFSFHAGSYGGYNAWREELAQLAGYEPVLDTRYRPNPQASIGALSASGGPFWELICFADNEGVIGPEVSAKLAGNFAEYAERAGEHGYFAEKYRDWRKAFEMAAGGGAVDFH
jgi:hypothetical protein